jgi:GcrA cell cycle regulator
MTTKAEQFDWNAETIARLRILWAEGHGTKEIGLRLGCSKNSVVGKAHRLDLPARPSPIGLSSGASPYAAQQRIHQPHRRTVRPTLPPLASLSGSVPRPQPIPKRVAATPKPKAPKREQLPKAIYRLPPQFGRVATCCWPIGEVGREGFRFCDSVEVVPGRSYCWEHVKKAYVRVRDRREDVFAEAA